MSTHKYPPLQLEQIKSIIIDCQIRRLTNMETHERLRNAGIEISLATVRNYKAQIKQQAGTWISSLARSRRSAYIAQYREKIFEIEGVQKKLWAIIEDDKTGPRTKVEACNSLMVANSHLIELYDCLPIINSIRDCVDAYENEASRLQEKENNKRAGLGPWGSAGHPYSYYHHPLPDNQGTETGTDNNNSDAENNTGIDPLQ